MSGRPGHVSPPSDSYAGAQMKWCCANSFGGSSSTGAQPRAFDQLVGMLAGVQRAQERLVGVDVNKRLDIACLVLVARGRRARRRHAGPAPRGR